MRKGETPRQVESVLGAKCDGHNSCSASSSQSSSSSAPSSALEQRHPPWQRHHQSRRKLFTGCSRKTYFKQSHVDTGEWALARGSVEPEPFLPKYEFFKSFQNAHGRESEHLGLALSQLPKLQQKDLFSFLGLPCLCKDK